MKMRLLSKSQEKLIGKKTIDMTDDELLDWIKACVVNEKAKLPMKARRSWQEGRIEAEAEIRRREARAP